MGFPHSHSAGSHTGGKGLSARDALGVAESELCQCKSSLDREQVDGRDLGLRHLGIVMVTPGWPGGW